MERESRQDDRVIPLRKIQNMKMKKYIPIEENGIDIGKIAKGFREAYYSDMRKLREYVVKRKESESAKFASIYVDIISKIDEILKV